MTPDVARALLMVQELQYTGVHVAEPPPERPDARLIQGTAPGWRVVVCRFSIEDQGFAAGSVGYDGMLVWEPRALIVRMTRPIAERVFHKLNALTDASESPEGRQKRGDRDHRPD